MVFSETGYPDRAHQDDPFRHCFDPFPATVGMLLRVRPRPLRHQGLVPDRKASRERRSKNYEEEYDGVHTGLASASGCGLGGQQDRHPHMDARLKKGATAGASAASKMSSLTPRARFEKLIVATGGFLGFDETPLAVNWKDVEIGPDIDYVNRTRYTPPSRAALRADSREAAQFLGRAVDRLKECLPDRLITRTGFEVFPRPYAPCEADPGSEATLSKPPGG